MSSIFSFETMWKIWLKYSSFYWDGVKTVSYTHLDVYKRQGLD